MNSLPFELFTSILSLLDHKSRCQASLVCHNWHQRLQQSDLLLQTILCTDINKHQVMKRFFKNVPTTLRNKVHTIYYPWIVPIFINELLELNELFPNIEEIQILISPNYFEAKRFGNSSNSRIVTTTSNNVPYWTRLKRVRESSEQMHSLSILEHHRLEHLVRLDLDFKHAFNINVMTGGSNHYFSYFKNAPHLENVTLWHIAISYGDLDTLHKGSPSIIELTLFNPLFNRHPEGPQTGYHDPLPTIHYIPQPADTVKAIRFYDVVFMGAVPLLSYVVSKYKRLSTCIITSKLSDRRMMQSRHQPHVHELCIDEMTHFTCDLVDMTPELLQRFSMHVLTLTSFNISEGANCVELLRILATTSLNTSLKSLEIRNRMSRLETCLEYISQLENLDNLVIEPRQDEDLDFDDNPEEEIYEQDDGYDDAERYSISLNILDRLSKLKRLSIDSFHVYIDEAIKENNCLEILELMDCTIERRNVFNTLSSCSQLKKITLFCYVHIKKGRRIRLKLLNNRLLEKIDVWIKGYPSMRYHGPEGEKSWYELERRGGYVTYYPSEQKGGKYFRLECQSADLFFIPQRYNTIYH